MLRWIEKHPEHVVRSENAYAVDRALAVRKHVTFDTLLIRCTGTGMLSSMI